MYLFLFHMQASHVSGFGFDVTTIMTKHHKLQFWSSCDVGEDPITRKLLDLAKTQAQLPMSHEDSE